MNKAEIAKLLLEIQANDAIRYHDPYVKALALAVPAVLFPAPDLKVAAQANDDEPIYNGDPGAAIPTKPWVDLPSELYPKRKPPMLHVYKESLLERRAWEILMQHLRPGQAVRVEDCFDIAERFAAEAAKRRGGS